jgi:hypothetical protein
VYKRSFCFAAGFWCVLHPKQPTFVHLLSAPGFSTPSSRHSFTSSLRLDSSPPQLPSWIWRWWRTNKELKPSPLLHLADVEDKPGGAAAVSGVPAGGGGGQTRSCSSLWGSSWRRWRTNQELQQSLGFQLAEVEDKPGGAAAVSGVPADPYLSLRGDTRYSLTHRRKR